MNRAALTLFEVTISMGLVLVMFTVAIALLPKAVRVQEDARYQTFACATALDLMEKFYNLPAVNFNIDAEICPDPPGASGSLSTGRPWDTVVGYRAMSFDLDSKLPSMHYGLLPLPTVIARRLDADGDEIQRLLDRGGQLYYGNPVYGTGIHSDFMKGQAAPSETRKLVYAFVGSAQLGTIPVLPWKAWPYYSAYPSPPSHEETADPDIATVSATNLFPADPNIKGPWSLSNMMLVNPSWGDCDAGARPYSGGSAVQSTDISDGTYPFSQERSRRYVAVAYWFAQKKGLPIAWIDGDVLQTSSDVESLLGGANPADLVNATRFLAHAAMTLTRHYDQAVLAGSGVEIRPDTASGQPFYAFDSGFTDQADLTGTIRRRDATAEQRILLTETRIKNLHQNCMRVVMRFAAGNPYNWGAPRPVNRAIMMDVPLFEWDVQNAANLLSGDHSPDHTGASYLARQWRPITPITVTGQGRNRTMANRPLAIPWGSSSNATLTARFNPDERCRQLVVWAVDWQSYEDAETAPSAPVDASRFSYLAQNPNYTPQMGGGPGVLAYATDTFANRINRGLYAEYGIFADRTGISFRNPEKHLLFTGDVSGMATGSTVGVLGSDGLADNNDLNGVPADHSDRNVFIGLYGADRNWNGILDRGPVPASARRRASLVARFNVYDPRLPLSLR